LFRLGSPEAYDRALSLAADAKRSEADRATLIDLLGQVGKPECVPVLLKVLSEGKGDSVRGAALSALQTFPDAAIADKVLALYPSMSSALRGKAQTLLLSRPASTLKFLQAVDAGQISPKEVPLDQLFRITLHKDEQLTKLVEKHWGKIGQQTTAEKISRIRAIAHSLALGTGDLLKGKELFVKNCATCHTLFGEGNKIGPDLTSADRKNREYLITQIVDPSAVIRPEFVAHLVVTKDGRSLTGLLAESTPTAVTLLDAKNQRTVIPRDKIEEIEPSSVSLMPEKILDTLDEQQVRDLFSYLQSDGPKAAGPR
jgi:putative heme-binding domain-containing protein